jgi:PAS domain S-box-containing protein
MATGRWQARRSGDETDDPTAAVPRSSSQAAIRFPRGTSEHVRIDPLEAADEAADEAIVLVDDRGRVVALNPLAATLLGFERDALAGTPIGVVLRCSTVDRGAVHEYGFEIHGELGPDTQLFARHHCGLQIPVEITLDRSSTNAIAITLRAIRDRRPAVVPRQCDELAMLAHDLKSPLSVIAIEIEMLRQVVEPNAGTAASMARIARNVASADRLLEDIVDLSRIETNELAIERDEVDLVAVVADVTERARITCEARGSAVIRADGRRIARVIGNLIDHVLRRAADPARVTVCVDIGADVASVSVIDQAPRAAAERKLALQAFRSSPRVEGRANVGLFVSRAIIEAHGGRIGVAGVGGQMRFYFELPVR